MVCLVVGHLVAGYCSGALRAVDHRQDLRRAFSAAPVRLDPLVEDPRGLVVEDHQAPLAEAHLVVQNLGGMHRLASLDVEPFPEVAYCPVWHQVADCPVANYRGELPVAVQDVAAFQQVFREHPEVGDPQRRRPELRPPEQRQLVRRDSRRRRPVLLREFE